MPLEKRSGHAERHRIPALELAAPNGVAFQPLELAVEEDESCGLYEIRGRGCCRTSPIPRVQLRRLNAIWQFDHPE
jgi:hypothetical protein